jgi:lysophospholipase L1-like esterase
MFSVFRSRRQRRSLFVGLVLGLVAAGCGGSNPVAPSTPAPTLSCPATQTATSPDGGAVQVSYQVPSASGGAPPVTVACTPSSGSLFPVGTTEVTCTATDARQRSASCGFQIVVEPPPPRLAVTRFVAFGNSITEGKLPEGVIAASPYPALLQDMLAARYTAQTIQVLNYGRSGEFTAAGLERLPGVLDAEHPDVLLLLEGVNDLAFGESSAIPPMADRLRLMVREAHNRNIRVLLGTLLPTRAGGTPDRGSNPLPLVAPANDQIRLAAALEGAALVDLWASFGGSPDPWIGGDGLHPTQQGYQRIADLWMEAIRSRFEVAEPAGYNRILWE